MRTIEQNIPLSQSLLWQTQREYYQALGVEAWATQVPSFVTSNPFIAEHYAQLITFFIRDYLAQNPAAQSEPFYILELGAGSGKFSFYCLTALVKYLKPLNITYKYIMSDLPPDNVNFWREHSAFQRALNDGVLELMTYDVLNDELALSNLANPLCVVANYLFDSLPQDVFHVGEGVAKPALLSLTTPQENIAEQEVLDWQKITASYTSGPAIKDYYQQPGFNQILQEYAAHLKRSSVIFPIASLQALAKLQQKAPAGLVLLSSDNGICHLDEWEDLADPFLSFHGSISMVVNYHAIARYCELQQGRAIMPYSHAGLKTCVFTLGVSGMLENFYQAACAFVLQNSPADFFNYHKLIADHYESASLSMLLSYLTTANFDPYGFSLIYKRILALLPEADYESVFGVRAALAKVLANYYFMPGSLDSCFDVGVVYHALKDYAEAKSAYLLSVNFFGEQFNVMFNLALCCFHLQQFEQAKAYFAKAQVLDPDAQGIEEWFNKCDAQL